jgi:hypothetical protein
MNYFEGYSPGLGGRIVRETFGFRHEARLAKKDLEMLFPSAARHVGQNLALSEIAKHSWMRPVEDVETALDGRTEAPHLRGLGNQDKELVVSVNAKRALQELVLATSRSHLLAAVV